MNIIFGVKWKKFHFSCFSTHKLYLKRFRKSIYKKCVYNWDCKIHIKNLSAREKMKAETDVIVAVFWLLSSFFYSFYKIIIKSPIFPAHKIFAERMQVMKLSIFLFSFSVLNCLRDLLAFLHMVNGENCWNFLFCCVWIVSAWISELFCIRKQANPSF